MLAHDSCLAACRAPTQCTEECIITKQARARAADDVDEMRDAGRPTLGLADIATVLERARAAVKRSTEFTAREAFDNAIRPMLPSDPCTETRDGWVRLGAHAGATAAWASEVKVFYPPKDAPSAAHAHVYVAARGFAASVVWMMRGETWD